MFGVDDFESTVSGTNVVYSFSFLRNWSKSCSVTFTCSGMLFA